MSTELYEESISSAAIDGVRINTVVTRTLINLDTTIPDPVKAKIGEALAMASHYLDTAGEILESGKLIVTPPTSIHIVR